MINSFGLSVEELMELDIMKDAKILSGKSGINRRITKMNVMEVPDILDWVSSGEFLLTTAYSIKDDIHQLDRLIPELSKKNITGIGIKTKRYIENIPQSIIDKSNECKFPIIEIPYDVSFSEIIMPVLTEITNRQSGALTQTYEFHNRLINIIIHGGSLQEIADAIYKSIENPLVICEMIFKTHVVVAENDFKEKIEDMLKEKIDYTTNTNIEDVIDGEIVKRIIIPIKVDKKVYGYINIWEKNRKLTPMEITIINSSTPIITLDLMKKLSVFQIENKHRIKLFDNLFSEDEARVKQAFENKIFFDFNKDKEYSIFIINASNESYLIEKLTKALDVLISDRNEQIIYANKG
ncbi:MAG: PucR family transcriptional regulator ligand-binding domain-containing protein, partial [Clostridiales bacterium]|nr:PucR family transcriptional regulator ligand-binding domain-containing protein [Clostridiales bacterium]